MIIDHGSEEMLMVCQGATLCSVFNVGIVDETQKAFVYLAWGHGYILAINARNKLDSTNTGHQPQSWYPLFMHLLAMDCASAMLEFVIFSTSLRFN